MFYLFVRKDCTQSNYYATKGCLRGNDMTYLYPVALIASRIACALPAWGGFLTGQQIISINVFFVKYDVLVFVPLHVFVMCRNILASLIVNSSRVYKALPTAVSHTSTREEPQWFAF